MSKTRILGRFAVAGVVLSALALPSAADGLSRFEKALKKAPADTLTYKSGKALGDNGFILENAVLTPPPDSTQGAKAEPIQIKRVTVEDFDFDAVDKNATPKFAKLRVEGIAISGKPAEGIDLQQLAGIDKITADFQLDYRLDPDRKTGTLNRLELDVNGLARMELSMVLDDFNADQLDKPGAGKNATLRTASFVFEDRSLLSKVLPAASKTQGIEPDVLVGMGKALLHGLRAGQSTATLAAFDAVESYLDDYKQPKGPLRVTLSPPDKTALKSLENMKSPDEVVKALGLVVSYAGTKPHAPPAAAPTGATADATGKAGCTPGARFFVMHEDAWWSVTVRAPVGDQCGARIDGGSADDDLTFALDKTVAWTIDGPGTPVTKCNDGDKVVVENDGGWYPAKITSKAASEGQCPVKFDGPDGDEDTIELKKIRRLN